MVLTNVFSFVRNPHEDELKTYPPRSFLALPDASDAKAIPGWHVPKKNGIKNTNQAYRRLWECFEKDFKKLKEVGGHYNVNAVLHLLEKYTACVPSMTLRQNKNEEENLPDAHSVISLFDHLKTTAAFVFCLFDYYSNLYGEQFQNEVLVEEITGKETWTENAESPFLLVGGDISGVQRFIYTISSKGALKSLKGRSFFLELLLEHTVQRLLEKLQIYRCNVVFTGGGHFYVIVPNTERSRNEIKAVKREINDFLAKNFAAALELFIEHVPFNKASIANVSRVWSQLSSRLESAKKRRWEDYLQDFFSGAYEPHPSCYVDRCEICGREDQPLKNLREDIEVKACEGCRSQFILGEMLQKAVVASGEKPVIYRWDGSPPENLDSISIAGSFYTVKSRYDYNLGKAADAVYHVNEWDLSKFCHPRSGVLFAGVYMPRIEDALDLESMAGSGLGMNRLGALRMDVDRLGRVFAECVSEELRSFALMASLSRKLSLFFKYHLNGVLAQWPGYPARTNLFPRPDSMSKDRLVSVVYSGGDDLFILGHWLDVIEAAMDIREAFLQFTANPYLTISGGMISAKAHDPVYRLAELAGSAEDKAKGEGGRRAVTILENYVFPWASESSQDVRELRSFINLLLPFLRLNDGMRNLRLREGGPSRTFLYSFMELVRRQDKLGQWILPKLAYMFGRTAVSKDMQEEWQALKNYVFSEKARGWRHIEAALVMVLMVIRERSE
jgi:CRISPR-associated protein Csm1